MVPTLKVLELVKNIVADDRVQLSVLKSFEPLPFSPSDDQAMGYQLLQQTICSVFPEVNIIVPGNDFISCGWWVVVAGTAASYLMPLPLCPNTAIHPGNSWPLLSLEIYFPLGVEAKTQTGKEQKQ